VPKNWKNGCSLFAPNPETQHDKVEVNLITLDKIFINQSKKRDTLLWLDCEGSELDSLIGGKSFVDDRVMMINIEMTGVPRGRDWCKPIDTYRCLREYGFLQCYTHTHRTSIGQFDCVFVRPEIFKPEFCSCFESVLLYEQA
jgi:hypothetical protein